MILWARRNWWAIGLFVIVALFAHIIGAGASGFTMNSPPGANQVSRTAMTVTSSLQDPFTVGGTVNLNGQISDFDGGGGFVTNGGPTWSALTGGSVSADWSNNTADYVTRNAGGTTDAVAVLDYLTRESTVSVTLTNVANNTEAGVINGSDATGTKGVVAALFRIGAVYTLRLLRVDTATTYTQCASVTLPGAAGTSYRVSLTYTPSNSTADVASAQVVRTGGGGGTHSVSNPPACQLDSANENYAGMFSGRATTTRYDGFGAVL